MILTEFNCIIDTKLEIKIEWKLYYKARHAENAIKQLKESIGKFLKNKTESKKTEMIFEFKTLNCPSFSSIHQGNWELGFSKLHKRAVTSQRSS